MILVKACSLIYAVLIVIVKKELLPLKECRINDWIFGIQLISIRNENKFFLHVQILVTDVYFVIIVIITGSLKSNSIRVSNKL